MARLVVRLIVRNAPDKAMMRSLVDRCAGGEIEIPRPKKRTRRTKRNTVDDQARRDPSVLP